MKTTTIIPIHELNEEILKYYDNAINSLLSQVGYDNKLNVILVYPEKLNNELIVHNQKYLNNDKISLLYVKNKGKTDYQSQVNLAVESVVTDYFTVLEFDDEFNTTFFQNIEKYIEYYNDVDVYMNMIIEIDKEGNAIKFTNEMVWSHQFTDENGEIGFLNSKSLQQYSDFKLYGAVINTKKFKEIGGYKSNIKLTFMYEFLLRALNNSLTIMTVPKLGYQHLTDREGSLFVEYGKKMPMKERKFWFDTALKEYHFNNDRIIEIPKFSE